jgi:hypothetical protein
MEICLTTKKTLILAQCFISLSMAFLMTGIFGFIGHGPTFEWLRVWMTNFVTAWPIAFVLSMVTGKYSFMLAHRLTRAAG